MVGPDRVAPEPERRPAAARLAARNRGRGLLADACWIGILLAAGSFQIGRGAPAEGVPFVLAALALVADELGVLGRADVALAAPRAPRWAVAAVIAAAAVAVAVTREFDWPAAVLVTAAGLAAVAPAWSARQPRGPFDGPALPVADRMPAAVRRAALGWAAVAVALCLWELAAFFAGLSSASADWEHPALSDLVRPAVGLPPVRALLFAAWLAAGWAFARRGWPAGGAAPGTDPELSGGGAG
jgi:hypothetical protein